MTDIFSSFGKPSVLFLGELDELSFSLVKKLLESGFKVFLLTKNTRRWKQISNGFRNQENIQLIKEEEVSKIERIDYVFYIYGFSKAISRKVRSVNSEISKGLLKISLKLTSVRSKNLVLLPAIYGINRPANFKGKNIYFSETIGPYMPQDNKYFIYSFLKAVAHKEKVFLPEKGDLIKPISSDRAAEKILEVFFSLGFPNEITIVGEAVSPQVFVEKIGDKGIHPDKKIKKYREYTRKSQGEEISLGSIEGVNNTIEFLSKTQKPILPKIKKRITGFKRLALFLVLGLSLPFLSLLTSAAFLGASIFLLNNGENNLTSKTLRVSRAFATVGSIGFGILGEIPQSEKIMELPRASSEILARFSALAIRGLALSQDMKQLLTKFFGDESYDVSGYSQNISSEIEYIYEESGFILGEVNYQPALSKLFRSFVDASEIERIRGMLIPISQVIENLPELLGASSPKKYLVLFQNNMELRPTGGYIGSFSLISVEGGRLTNFEVWDVFEADGQLKGHVEPPPPIKLYLDEANWYLRDSNWDPDFSVSAARAEWFLDKEIDEKVDGVIGVDLEFVKSLIFLTGPLDIADYDVLVDEKNLYEVTQREVEEDFFPGSTKKSSFLTALSKALMANLKNIEGENMNKFTINTLQSLDGRHVQLFVHQKSIGDLINQLGWDGALSKIGSCGNNCYSDVVGIVEANVGVNKVNFYISRATEVSVTIEDEVVKRELKLSIKNTADPALGAKGIYKVYIRAFGPQDASFEKVKLTQGANTIELTAEEQIVRDRKEVGVLVLVSPKQSNDVVFTWTSPLHMSFNNPGEYRLRVRKQGGVKEHPLTVNISNFQGSLTPEERVSYNAFLARDFVSRIYW